MRILVVDDEAIIVKGIRFNLENDGYEVLTGSNGKDAVEIVRQNDVDLVILDLMMPQMDGLEACRTIRGFSDVPIIMLTAKADDMDKLMGFDYGADDYITKPFNILELKARIRALLRRTAGASRDNSTTVISHGDISADSAQRSAWKSGRPVDLTAKEFDLIELLMQNPGRVYSREALLNTVWGYDFQSDIRTVDVHIRRLREKLETNPASPEHIMTKWGVGYYFKA